MTPRIAAAAAALLSITKGFSKSARYSIILFWCSIARRWNGWAVSGNSVAIRKERAADYFGPVRVSFEFGQGLTQVLCGSGLEKDSPKELGRGFRGMQHQGVLAFEMMVKRSLCDFGEGHDLLGAGRADALCVEEPVDHLQNSLPWIGLVLVSFIKLILTAGRQICLYSSYCRQTRLSCN